MCALMVVRKLDIAEELTSILDNSTMEESSS